MHKIKSQTAPKIFQNKFRKPPHKYPKTFSPSNDIIRPFQLSKSKYRISEHKYRTFLQTLRKSKQPFLKILWEKSF